jgi:hypothetical protein
MKQKEIALPRGENNYILSSIIINKNINIYFRVPAPV